MVGASKILTVSYGTFSCTLEGFDDPFGTMKAIAEYFRDLAAEDRYFGAEPPQPDAQMLHRIAEREIQRRVEAKIQDNGVILRAADLLDRPVPVARPQPAPEPVAPAPTVVEAAEPAPRLLAVDDGVAAKLARIRAAVDRSRVAAPMADDIEDAEQPADPVQVAAGLADDLPEADAPLWAEDTPADPAADAEVAAEAAFDDDFAEDLIADLADDSADLADDRAELPVETMAKPATAPVAEAGSDDAVAAPLPAVAEEAAPAPAPPVADAAKAELPVAEAAEPAQPPVAEPATAPRQVSGWHLRRRQRRLNREAAALAAATAAPEAPAAETPLPVAPLADPAPSDDFDLDALEAALEDIEAEAAAAASPLVEPAPVMDAIEAALPSLPALDLPDTAEVLPEPALVAEAPSMSTPEPEPEQVAAPAQDDVDMLIARLSAGTPPAPTSEPEVATEPAPRARIVKVRRARPSEALADEPSDAPAAAEVQPAEAVVEAEVPVEAPVEAPAQLLRPDEALADQPEPAIDAATATPVYAQPDQPQTDDADEEVAPAPAAAATPAQPVRPSRPVPARPVVQRPVTQRPVAPRADVTMPHTGAPVSPARPVRPERVADRRSALDRGANQGEAAVDRLLRQADTEMAEADTRRRTSTIAHLKAAVAATVAERLAPRGPDTPTEPDATAVYRNDLATAVRPRRPGEPDAAAQSPADQARVAPLVLVSAQRIDRPAPPQTQVALAMPSRPRGAAVSALAYEDEDEDDGDTAEGAPGNLFGGIGAFPDWAHAAGAIDLADRLEAAAAWLMEAEGLEGFNRPQLMRLAAADEAAESREAAMAAFGALLREGRIVKSRRGIFTLPATSLALAKARKAAR
jgi:hypothetical protein